jgi:hypothetical protein
MNSNVPKTEQFPILDCLMMTNPNQAAFSNVLPDLFFPRHRYGSTSSLFDESRRCLR